MTGIIENGFGMRLRAARERLGLHQQQLADRVGLTQAAVSFHEMGQRRPRPTLVFDYASALGVRPGWLAGMPLRELYAIRLEAATKDLDRRSLDVVCSVAEAMHAVRASRRNGSRGPYGVAVAEAQAADLFASQNHVET